MKLMSNYFTIDKTLQKRCWFHNVRGCSNLKKCKFYDLFNLLFKSVDMLCLIWNAVISSWVEFFWRQEAKKKKQQQNKTSSICFPRVGEKEHTQSARTEFSQTPLNIKESLLCPWEKKALFFSSSFNALNTDTFYGHQMNDYFDLQPVQLRTLYLAVKTRS